MFNFTGRLFLNNPSMPLAEAKFEIFDITGSYGWLGEGRSDTNGRFLLQLPDDVGEKIKAQIIDVQIRIFKGTEVVYQTIITPVIEDNEIAVPLSAYDNAVQGKSYFEAENIYYTIIYGVVLGIKGLPIITKVQALEAGFRDRTFITSTETDSSGHYELKIASKQITHVPIARQRSIVVEVVNSDGTVLVGSDLLAVDKPRIACNFLVEDVNVVPVSEFSAAGAAINQYTGKADISTITTTGIANEITYLQSATGLSFANVINVVSAYKYAASAGAEDGIKIDPKFFYALIRTTQKQDLIGLIAYPTAQIITLIKKAIEDFVIDSESEDAVKEAAEAIVLINVSRTKAVLIQQENASIGETLNTVFNDNKLVDNFLKHATTFEGNNARQFWKDFQTAYGVIPANKLKKGLQLLSITGFQPDMAAYLLKETGIKDNIYELALKTTDEWVKAIDAVSASIGTPAVPKVVVSEKGVGQDPYTYAAKLKEITQNLFPLTGLRAKLEGKGDNGLIPDPATRNQVNAFITQYPKFDLRFQSIYDITENLLPAGANLEEVQNALMPIQSLTRLVGGKPDAIADLMSSGIKSALDITSLSEDQFVSQYSAALGNAGNARRVHASAGWVSAAAGAGATMVKQTKNNTVYPAFPVLPTYSASPQLATLFGSQEQCGCEYCMSVYSPAAYYVDIMNFLRKESLPSEPAYNELIRRRPDLPYIDLTCKNTNTPVPYIDLVNELLEKFILDQLIAAMPSLGTPILRSFQTTGKAAELAARAEHVIRTTGTSNYINYTNYTHVYDDALSKAVYPNNLPFNLALEESRIYFKHLGISRYELMNLYKPWNTTALAPTEITDANLSAEYLGISKESADIITNTNSPSPWIYYGFAAASSSAVISIQSPSDTSVTLSGTWYNLLRGNVADGGIDVIIQQLKISYKELLQLLTTRFLNPKVGTNRSFAIAAKAGKPADTCILKDLELFTTLGAAVIEIFFARMHRFIRLWRASGMSIYAVDQLLSSMSASDINAAIFGNFVQALILAAKLDTSPEKISSWWSDIDTEHYLDYNSERQDVIPSLYDRLFKSKSVLNPPDPAFSVVNSSGLPVFSGNYQDHIAAISAATGISDDNLYALIAAHNFSPGTTMSLAGLSWLLATATISKGLKLSVSNFIRFADLAGFSLSTTPGSAGVQLTILKNVVQALNDISSTGFSLDETFYLLKNEDPQGAFIPKEPTIQIFYEGLRRELKKIQSTDNIANLPNALANAIVQQFATNFTINAETGRYLLSLLEISKISTSSTFIPLLTAFADQNFIDGIYDLSLAAIATTQSTTPLNLLPDWDLDELYVAYYRIAKIAFILNRLRIKQPELAALQANNANLHITDLTALPVKSGAAALNPTWFSRFANWIQLRERLRIESDDFVLLSHTGANPLNPPLSKADWKALILSITGWDSASLDDLIGPYSISTTISTNSGLLHTDFPAASMPVYYPVYYSPEFIHRIADVMDASARIGLAPVQLIDSLYADIVIDDANKIMSAARAKHGESEWLNIAQPLNDVLREKQRQALVAYIIANAKLGAGPSTTKWRNENEVFAYLLIDVEMQPCMMTSRIKQAISSVQLFMDRLIMNLEYANGDPATPVALPVTSIEQWKTWRKWYRIWEVNRKIFLYPENWIEPELRDDKSPFFKELETQLLQDEVRSDKVEDAYYEYLEKLDEVARLEPVSSYHEKDEQQGIDIVHVVAKTYAQPQHYYYRRLENNQWSAWERMNLEIKGDHVALVVWNRRLHIYWLTFIEKSPTADEISAMKYEISQRAGNKWKHWIDAMDSILRDDINN